MFDRRRLIRCGFACDKRSQQISDIVQGLSWFPIEEDRLRNCPAH
ncbi:MAG: hypothetical protein V7L04_09490 [Nostoc sp.]